jgi:hypothetical protein
MKYYRVKEEGNIHHTTRRRKVNWVGDVLHRDFENQLFK